MCGRLLHAFADFDPERGSTGESRKKAASAPHWRNAHWTHGNGYVSTRKPPWRVDAHGCTLQGMASLTTGLLLGGRCGRQGRRPGVLHQVRIHSVCHATKPAFSSDEEDRFDVWLVKDFIGFRNRRRRESYRNPMKSVTNQTSNRSSSSEEKAGL